MLVGLPDGHRAELVADALAAAITTLPRQLTRSLTWDQGHEMAEHARFTVDTGVAVYFCDPKSPWQRGSNENTNGLLRQYLPRHVSLWDYSQDDLDGIAPDTRGKVTLIAAGRAGRAPSPCRPGALTLRLLRPLPPAAGRHGRCVGRSPR
jgi:hypothetical protein